MEEWTTFWGWLLGAVLVIYTCLTIVITIGGFSDVKRMLTTIDDQHKSDRHAESDVAESAPSD